MTAVAITHYHLKPGGVTRVVENACRGLCAAGCEVAVLTGEDYAGDADLPVSTVPAMAYRDDLPAGSAKALADEMEREASRLLGRSPDVWHVHNHSLGKSPVYTAAVNELARRGACLLLQIHDFAEDGRPGNYRRLQEAFGEEPAKQLYPQGDRVHYAVLNRRDHDILCGAGLPERSVHWLPNPVTGEPFDTEPARFPGERLFLYPTRGIRRKNIGELVLWAALGSDGDHWASTLPPANPEWLAIHDRWRAFARELNLPVDLGVVADGEFGFPQWIDSATALVTTSIAEGFGLAFLEPALFGKPVAGRDLPEVTDDFRAAGVDPGDLYARLDVPIEWVDRERLRAKVSQGLEAYFASYGATPAEDAVDRWWESACREDRIDFGALDEGDQEAVIRNAAAGAAGAIEPAELVFDDRIESIQNRSEAIRRKFSVDTYGRRLAGLYADLGEEAGSSVDWIDGRRVLSGFLAPERFRLLRS